MKNEEQKSGLQNGLVEIFTVKDDYDGKLTLGSAVVQETARQYMLPCRISEFGFVLRIEKSQVQLSAKEAIDAFIEKNERGVLSAKKDILFHQANIKAAQKLYDK